ncbi:circularly permutated Ras protein 1 isoform X2 [Patella vulgata]|uniref:circularly permutated Ras protein 1 isoform X2 n=1 Tax=Patella vulgata TaxID=6465 RepID=UPI00217F5C7B|nr:circularly permutated Ras protein 1 isoform X2 [Patella vulgata]
MYFASKYVYDNTVEEYEDVSDDEYNEGLDVSDESDDDERDTPAAPPRPRVKPQKKRHHWQLQKESMKKEAKPCPPLPANKTDSSQPPKQPSEGKRRFRKADTNVVSVTLNTLKDASNMHAGDAVKCGGTGCKAIMSHLSKLSAGMSGKVWVCDFCGCNNEVDVEDGEIPAVEDVTFLIEAGLSTEAAGPSGQDESIVVFCIDVSGSMCVTTEVPGHVNFRRSANMDALGRFNRGGEDQYLPHQNRNVTNVSRLQAMQAAVDKQLEDLIKDHPNRRVAIIAFNNELLVMGDGSTTDQTIAGSKLDKLEELEKLGAELTLPRPIKTTKQILSNKVFGLEEGGATALGPSLVVALGLASRYSGSKIILCTDGLANVGLGRLDESSTDDSVLFYEQMGEKAVENGVSISVITIKGAESRLVQLGKLADLTSGQVNHVDPLKLTEEFSNILADRIIATNVTATFILHKNLVFFDEDTEENIIVKNIGNAKMDTEITFKYGKKASTSASSAPSKYDVEQAGSSTSMTREACPASGVQEDSQPNSQKLLTNPSACLTSDTAPTELPFQLQLEYTDTDGMKALRVLTQKRPVTQSRNLAEQHLNLEVLGPYTAKTCANLALKGQYTQSRGVALMNQRLAWRNTRDNEKSGERKIYNKMFGKIRSVDHHVNHRQQAERSRFGRSYSDDEEEDEDRSLKASKKESCPAPSMMKKESCLVPVKGMAKARKRTEEYPDDMANDMYNMKHMSRDDLMK